jgi:hypothetical protein
MRFTHAADAEINPRMFTLCFTLSVVASNDASTQKETVAPYFFRQLSDRFNLST